MVKVYEQSKDKNVAAVVIYPGTGSNATKAYIDSAATTQIGRDALVDAFKKGCIIDAGSSTYYIPVKLIVSGSSTATKATVTYVKADTTTATTAVLATLESTSDAV